MSVKTQLSVLPTSTLECMFSSSAQMWQQFLCGFTLVYLFDMNLTVTFMLQHAIMHRLPDALCLQQDANLQHLPAGEAF